MLRTFTVCHLDDCIYLSLAGVGLGPDADLILGVGLEVHEVGVVLVGGHDLVLRPRGVVQLTLIDGDLLVLDDVVEDWAV